MPEAEQKKVLLSFVGTNDSAALTGKGDGAVITALKNEKFDELILFCNNRVIDGLPFKEIAEKIGQEAKQKKLIKNIVIFEIRLNDITDHNEIYLEMRKAVQHLPKNENIAYTAAISSGTPAMQVCWILLAESGDFSLEYPLRLIKVKDPRFGKSENIDVKLDAALPKIIRMQNEITQLKNELLPSARIDVRKGTLQIGNNLIDLTPMEFCYYRYFAEKKIDGIEEIRIGGVETTEEFALSIYRYHEETFPALDLLREELRKSVKAGQGIAITTFRGNITKLNRKITSMLEGETVQTYFIISAEGKRGAKFYTIKAPAQKLKIIR